MRPHFKREPAMPHAVSRIVLKPGREKSLRHRHPWVFSGAIASVDGGPASGDTVEVRDANGSFLALAAYSPESQIRARAWTYREAETVDAGFLRERLAAAIGRRAAMLDAGHTACRLVHAESDGLPGLVVDRYGEVLVVQVLSAGPERWKDEIVAALASITGLTTIFERSDVEVRTLEGLAPRTGAMLGAAPGPVGIVEDAIRYEVNVVSGQKTGFYLDQRDNRRIVRDLAAGAEVLNAFCYTGGFSLAALAGGAKSVLSIDSSEEAIGQAGRNLALNAFDGSLAEFRDADVFETVRKLRDQGRQFDLIILDPPKFAPTERHVEKAARAYKDVNLWAFKLLRPGGRLVTFSCSGAVSRDLFQKIVAGAAVDAGVDAAIERPLAASADHPVSLTFPEGEYLKGLQIRRA
jgi:23S rRNA (cytosine1962-C5)-methyltransferase